MARILEEQNTIPWLLITNTQKMGLAILLPSDETIYTVPFNLSLTPENGFNKTPKGSQVFRSRSLNNNWLS
ncbi:MAG: hypothetical protein ACXACH_03480, partial [Candidatus Hermodarchaeia archaeon]